MKSFIICSIAGAISHGDAALKGKLDVHIKIGMKYLKAEDYL
jgi:hypothetical protein